MKTLNDSAFGRLADSFEEFFRKHFALSLSLLVVIVLIAKYWFYGIWWDPLLDSGVIVFAIGLRLAQRLPDKMAGALNRLKRRESILFSKEPIETVLEYLDKRSERWKHYGGFVTASVILIAFLAYFVFVWKIPNIASLILAILECFGGFIAGRYLGLAASYGGLWGVLTRNEVVLCVQPGHVDGAAGLKPIGDFYFFQSMLVAIPAAYLAVWWAIIPVVEKYHAWREIYLWILGFVLIVEIAAFIWPMWSFHKHMQGEKEKLLSEADELGRQILKVRSELVAENALVASNNLKDSLSAMTERYISIEQMPVWPVSPEVRKRFAVRNVVLILPTVGKLILEAAEKMYGKM